MEILLTVSILLALLALALLWRTFRHLRRGRVLRAGGNFAGSATTAATGGAGIVLATSLFSYGQLTGEQLVSQIEFTQTAPDGYTARLMIDGRLDQLLPMTGDEWQLDARIITWEPPLTILGFAPIYRLERLSGRYANIDDERAAARSVHALAEDRNLDLWSLARRYPLLTPGVDAYYGTATYVPMADGARFDVYLSRDALIARPANDAARRAVGEWRRDGT